VALLFLDEELERDGKFVVARGCGVGPAAV
jgi:hypothetical protein